MDSPSTSGPVLGFLHTASSHIKTFDNLVHSADAHIQTRHLVLEELLVRARSHGIDHETLIDAMPIALNELVDQGANLIICTCSTIAGLAEDIGSSVPVLRVDRPAATLAITTGHRIAVVAAVESTLAPTVALLNSECHRVGRHPIIDVAPCLNAWTLFEGGDIDAYHRRVAAHVEALDPKYDTVFLAQASMLGVLSYIETRPGRQVLASPVVAVSAAIDLLHLR